MSPRAAAWSPDWSLYVSVLVRKDIKLYTNFIFFVPCVHPPIDSRIRVTGSARNTLTTIQIDDKLSSTAATPESPKKTKNYR